MQIEAIVLFSVITGFLLLFAENYRKYVLGVLAGFNLLILGMWVTTDDIDFYAGKTITQTSTIQNALDGSLSGNNTLSNSSISSYDESYLENITGTTTTTTTETNAYSNLTTPYFQFNTYLGFFLIALGVYVSMFYIINVKSYNSR